MTGRPRGPASPCADDSDLFTSGRRGLEQHARKDPDTIRGKHLNYSSSGSSSCDGGGVLTL